MAFLEVSAGDQELDPLHPGTYLPIELKAKFDDGGGVDLRFPVYEELSPSAVSGGAFSLRAQHPGATLKVDKLAYEQRWSELAPAKP